MAPKKSQDGNFTTQRRRLNLSPPIGDGVFSVYPDLWSNPAVVGCDDMAREGKLEEPSAAAEMDGGAELKRRGGRRVKRKYRLRSNSRSDRVLRPRSKAAAKVSKVVASGGGRDGDEDEEVKRRGRRRKKNKRGRNEDKKAGNEFLRIRNNLSYMLHKIRYEKSLIDAYSGEGWKGMRYGN